MAFTVAATPTRLGYDFRYEREILDPLGIEIVDITWEGEQRYIERVRDLDAIVIGRGVTVTRAVIESLRNVKLIMNGAVGLDRIDVEAATEASIPVLNVPDVWVHEVADHAMLLLLAVARKLRYASEMAASGRWTETLAGIGSVPRLQGRTLGLISFGAIARNVARRAQAFGIKVVAFDPYVTPEVMAEHGVGARSLDDLLREADFVSVHAPLTAGTRGLLGAAQLALMKPTAILVNTGRGPVVDEAALIAALRAGTIAGAGLDVLEEEPPAPDNPLLSMPNALVTPHTAFNSDEAFIASRYRVAEEVAAVASGRRPRHVANPSVLERLSLA